MLNFFIQLCVTKLMKMMRNEFYIQRWMEQFDINDIAWRRDIVAGRDVLGLYGDSPQMDKLKTMRDDYDVSPLYYYCFSATPIQLDILFQKVPEGLWLTLYPSPLSLVGLGGNLDTFQWMIQWLNAQSDASGILEWKALFFNAFHAGHFPMIQWILSDQFPENLKVHITDDVVVELLQSGNLELIQWALSDDFPDEFKPQQWTVKYAVDDNHKAHEQAQKLFNKIFDSGHLSVIQWVFSKEFPDQFKPLFESYCARRDGKWPNCSSSCTDIRYLSTPISALSTSSSDVNFSPGLARLIMHADFSTIEWIYGSKIPVELKQGLLSFFANNNNFHQYAGYFGCDRLFIDSGQKNLPLEFKKLLVQRDKGGNTFLHYIAFRPDTNASYYNEYRKSLYYFITQQPELAASLWDIANNDGDTIDTKILMVYKRKNSMISAIQLLKQIIHAALLRISNSYPIIAVNDLRLLRAFKEKVLRFIKNPIFLDRTIAMKLLDIGAFQAIFGELTDKNLKIIFKFLRYEDRPTLTLNTALLDELMTDLASKKKLKIQGKFFKPTLDPFCILTDKINKINCMLRVHTSDDVIQKSAILMKLNLMDRKYQDSLQEDDQYLLVALRNV